MLMVDIVKKFSHFFCTYNFSTSSLISTISGASGSGKSTLFKCISGLLNPDEGIITLNGRTLFDSTKKINLKPQARKIGYCFQSFALFPTMNVRDNILSSLYREKDKKRKQKIFEQTVDMLSLSSVLHQYPSTLSGGQAQRVALARMIVCRSEIFLFDEVFSALDEDLSASVQKYVKSLIEELEIQSFFITHSTSEARFLSTNHYLLSAHTLSPCTL